MIHPDTAHPNRGSLLKHVLKQRLAISIHVGNAREVDGHLLSASDHASPRTLGFRGASPTQPSFKNEGDPVVAVVVQRDLQHKSWRTLHREGQLWSARGRAFVSGIQSLTGRQGTRVPQRRGAAHVSMIRHVSRYTWGCARAWGRCRGRVWRHAGMATLPERTNALPENQYTTLLEVSQAISSHQSSDRVV